MSALSSSWTDAIQKEERLRLRWYIRNEEKIRASAAKASSVVAEDKVNELTQIEKKIVQGNKRVVVKKPGELTFPGGPDGETRSIMKPILKEVDEIIYNQGRKAYLNNRIHVLPEDRYYFPETSAFIYGWNMWDCAKNMQMKRYGKSAVVKNTFYRRRAGIETDPEWYRTPPRISPTICNYAD